MSVVGVGGGGGGPSPVRSEALGLRTEQSERYYGDTVLAPIRIGTRRHDGSIEEVLAQHSLEPYEVLDVIVVDFCGELDLKGDDASIGAFDDEIHFMVSAMES